MRWVLDVVLVAYHDTQGAASSSGVMDQNILLAQGLQYKADC